MVILCNLLAKGIKNDKNLTKNLVLGKIRAKVWSQSLSKKLPSKNRKTMGGKTPQNLQNFAKIENCKKAKKKRKKPCLRSPPCGTLDRPNLFGRRNGPDPLLCRPPPHMELCCRRCSGKEWTPPGARPALCVGRRPPCLGMPPPPPTPPQGAVASPISAGTMVARCTKKSGAASIKKYKKCPTWFCIDRGFRTLERDYSCTVTSKSSPAAVMVIL